METELSVHDATNELLGKLDAAVQPIDESTESESDQTNENNKSEEVSEAISPSNENGIENETETEELEESESDEEVDDSELGSALTDDTLISLGDEDVSVNELKAGYLRVQDYTKKTQALADAKRQVGDLNEKTSAYAQVVMSVLGNIVNHFAGNFNQLPPQVQQVVQTLHQVNQNLEKQATDWLGEVKKTRDNSRKQVAEDAISAIKTRIPDWGPAKYQAVHKYYTETFNTPPELIAELVDAGMMTGLYEGMAKMTGEKSLKNKLTPSKALKGKRFKSGQNATPKRGKRSDGQVKAQQKLNKSGTLDDGVNLFLEVHKNG